MSTTCPHCQNKFGFVFGTCIECGFNHITNEFKWVRVYIGEEQVSSRAIYQHAQRTLREPEDK
jgi:hypothetical protein